MAEAQRPGPQGRKKAVCQVYGCGVDVTGLKTYNQRHKVCNEHLKAPVVEKDGLKQRFCQQCSRFHEVSEFDDDRRSCRKRLNKHNLRRRKTPTNLAAHVAGAALSPGGSADQSGFESRDGSASPTFSQDASSVFTDTEQLYASGSISGLLKNRSQRLMKQKRRGPRSNVSLPDLAHPSPSQTPGQPSRFMMPSLSGGDQAQIEPSSLELSAEDSSSYTPKITTLHLFIIIEACNASSLPMHMKSQFLNIFQGVVQMSVCNQSESTLLYIDLIQHKEGAKRPSLRTIVNSLISAGKDDTQYASIWLNGSWSAQFGEDGVHVSAGKILQEYDLRRDGTGSDIITDAAIQAGQYGPMLQLSLGTMQKNEIVNPTWATHARFDGYAMPVELQSFLGVSEMGITVGASLQGRIERGVVRLQSSAGGVVGNTKAVVMTDDSQLAWELQAARETLPHLDLLHEEVGCLVSFRSALDDGGTTSGFSWVLVSSRNLLRDIASNILCLACERGWLAMASIAMSVLTRNNEAPAVVIEEVRLRSPGVPSVLHRAVRSKDPRIVRWLLAWGEAHGYKWDTTAGGSQSVDALAHRLGNQEVLRVIRGQPSSSTTPIITLNNGNPVQPLRSSFTPEIGQPSYSAPMDHSGGFSATTHHSGPPYHQPPSNYGMLDGGAAANTWSSFGREGGRPFLDNDFNDFSALDTQDIWGSVISEGNEELEAATLGMFLDGEARPPSFLEMPRRRRSSITRRSTWAPSHFQQAREDAIYQAE